MEPTKADAKLSLPCTYMTRSRCLNASKPFEISASSAATSFFKSQISCSLSVIASSRRVSSSSTICKFDCCKEIFSSKVFWKSACSCWSLPRSSNSFCIFAILSAFACFSLCNSASVIAETGTDFTTPVPL